METTLLKEVAQFIGATNLKKDLDFLEQKIDVQCPLVLPLMGEFSAGKTSIINALSDSKNLETAITPTTATIFEMHFGCESSHADIYYADGTKESVENVGDLHNAKIADSVVVEVYDTSKRVPSSLVIVDTPGLSSSDPKHRQTLIDFIPNADGILLVSDINQPGLTRSLSEFVKTMELSKRRIFMILAKCDTKTEKEIVDAKKYIADNSNISYENIVAVSAKDNKMDELLSLLNRIHEDKIKIMEQVNEQRLINIAKQLDSRINQLLKASNSDSELDDLIRDQEIKLHRINQNIDSLLLSIKDKLAQACRTAERNFEDTVSSRLEVIVANKNSNFDAEAVSAINTTSSVVVSSLCDEIKNALSRRIQHIHSEEDNAVEFHSLDNVDLSKFTVDGLSYNLNLNMMGHEYDGHIATGLKIAGAVAAVSIAATAVAAEGAAGAASAAGAAEGAAGATSAAGQVVATTSRTYGTIDAVIDAAQFGGIIISNNKKERIKSQYNDMDKSDNQLGKQFGQDKGIVESMVGFVTEGLIAKPQRLRAIHEYVDSVLMPSFKQQLKQQLTVLITNVQSSLIEEAKDTINEMKQSLTDLIGQKKMKTEEFEAHKKQLNNYSETIKKTYLCGNLS